MDQQQAGAQRTSSPAQAARPAAPNAPQGQGQQIQRPGQRPQGAPGQQQPSAPNKDYGKDFRVIVRVAGKEINGELNLERGLSKIRGIGLNLARNLCYAIERELGIKRSKLVGNLSDDEISKVEELLRNPPLHLSRKHYFNRPVDPSSGQTRHLISNDLLFEVRQDVQFEKDQRTWKGWRHSIGQRVRGQHGRTTGRTGMSVGVLKKAIKMQKAAAATKAQEGSAPKAEKK